MAPDSEIGRVVAVDTAQVSIELNRDLKGMSRNTYEGTQEVGRINSYVMVPVGARRLVAMITRVVLVERSGDEGRPNDGRAAGRQAPDEGDTHWHDRRRYIPAGGFYFPRARQIRSTSRGGPIWTRSSARLSMPRKQCPTQTSRDTAFRLENRQLCKAGPFGSIPTRSLASTLPFWVAPARASPARSQLCCSPFTSNRE